MSEGSNDSVHSKRWESTLTYGLNRPEHTGRILGEGEGAPWKKIFGQDDSKCRKRKCCDNAKGRRRPEQLAHRKLSLCYSIAYTKVASTLMRCCKSPVRKAFWDYCFKVSPRAVGVCNVHLGAVALLPGLPLPMFQYLIRVQATTSR
ncbi:hypothetical protein BRADI_4g43119v3 [Brachypodium distachyon]|uniref:Uncharacterized protein n=1 Tax=Brachypodium distachyon TaxID=15368 RepID=A0A2K2CTX4_BRADI|nr:hypothetical protein BRADI_4g43119v3 [Brachypodium distachyon]